MKLDVFEFEKKAGEIELSTLIGDINKTVLYRCVVARLANKRQGNASTLTKSEVRGGGKKPWRQKGLGRARAGSIRSPLWRGGGVIFGPKPRDYFQKVNKKEKTLGYVSVFTGHFKNGSLKLIKKFQLSSFKTKDFLTLVSPYINEIKGRKVFIVDEYDKNILMASRNLPDVCVLAKDNLDILPLFYADAVFIFENAALALDEKYSKALRE